MWDYCMFDFTHNSPSNNAMSQVCKACWSQERLLAVRTVCAMFWSMWLDIPFCAESAWATSKVPLTDTYKCLLTSWRSLILLSVHQTGKLPSLEWKFMWDFNCRGLPPFSFFFPRRGHKSVVTLSFAGVIFRGLEVVSTPGAMHEIALCIILEQPLWVLNLLETEWLPTCQVWLFLIFDYRHTSANTFGKY